jgi:hypothetical protein
MSNWCHSGSFGGNTVAGALRHSKRHRDKVRVLRERKRRRTDALVRAVITRGQACDAGGY